ncbi:hypothetical protein V5799_006580 [Amblyomma americanum]|uniref:Uncharacterized protein n=1 Tax=Amblyomma americanum TaxID=6943 RepID=A0AAQ4DVZ4_AMBAM
MKSGDRASSSDPRQHPSKTSPEDSSQREESVKRRRSKKTCSGKRKSRRKEKAIAQDQTATTNADAVPAIQDITLKSTVEESQTAKRSSKGTRSPSVERKRNGEIKVGRKACPTVTSFSQPSSTDTPYEQNFGPPDNVIMPKRDCTKTMLPVPDGSSHSDKETGLKTLDTAFMLTSSTTRAPSHAQQPLDSEDDDKTRERISEPHGRVTKDFAQEADVRQEARNAAPAEENAPKKEEGLEGGVTSPQARSAVASVSLSECDAARDQPAGTSQKSTHEEQSLRSSSVIAPPLGVSCAGFCAYCAVDAVNNGSPLPRMTPLASKNLIDLENLEKFCETASCRSAVKEMAASADLLSEPCSDLRSFACGRWCALPIRPAASYWLEQRRRFVAAVDTSVLSIRRRAVFTGQPFYYMSAFYASCIGVLGSRKASIADSWTAAGIDVQLWMKASDFKSVLALTLDTAMSVGLTTVYKVVSIDNDTFDVSTGSAIAPADDGGLLRRMLVEEAATELLVDAESLHDKIRHIDDAVRDAIQKVNHTGHYGVFPCADFSGNNSLIWCEFFRRDSSSTYTVNMNSPTAVRAILHALTTAELAAAKVYLMLVPIAPFMLFEHMVRPARKRLSDSARREICVEVTGARVTQAYRLWVKTRVLDYGTDADVLRTVADIRQASKVTFKRFSGVADEREIEWSLGWPDGSAALAARNELAWWGLDKEAVSRHSVGNETFMPFPPVPEYGDDFIANIILLSRRGAFNMSGALAGVALLATNSVDAGNCSRRSPAAVAAGVAGAPGDYVTQLVPDAYYSGVREKLLNYATLGVLVAMEVFDAASSSIGVEAYAGCLADYARARLGVNLSAVGALVPSRRRLFSSGS